MKQILMVNGQSDCSTVPDFLSSSLECQVLELRTLKKPGKTLQQKMIDLMIIDPDTITAESAEAINWANDNFAATPTIVLTGQTTKTDFKQALSSDCVEIHCRTHLKEIFDSIIKLLDTWAPVELEQKNTLFIILQYFIVNNCTKSIEIKHNRSKATLALLDGNIVYAKCGKITGEKAFHRIMSWADPKFIEIHLESVQNNISTDSNTLMFETLLTLKSKYKKTGSKTKKNKPNQSPETGLTGEAQNTTKGANKMKEALSRLKDLDGFLAAGAFSAGGELLEQISMSDLHLPEVGALANDVLLKAQKSTDIMGVGRGNLIHVVAPKANILVRCLNENTDFAADEPGRVHVHLVLVMAPDGNIALGKMQIEKVIADLANSLR